MIYFKCDITLFRWKFNFLTHLIISSFKVYYNKKTATLALTDNMPYFDIFNELIREMLVSHALAKKDGLISNPDQLYRQIFYNRAMQEKLRRNIVRKPYWLGF